jgi:uncharacterized membrane protein YfcA
VPLGPSELAFLAIVFGAYFVGTVLGFGTSIIAVTFGAQLLELDVVLPIVCPLNVALSLYIAVRHHKSTKWRELFRRIIPHVALGVPLGLLLFNLGPLRWLLMGFGGFVIVLAALQLRIAFAPSGSATTDAVPLVGLPRTAMLFGGGVLHGLFSTGGPMVVYVLGRELVDKGAFRSTISTMFVPMTTALLIDYAYVGKFTNEVFVMIAWSLIPLVGGLLLGEWAHARFENNTFKRAVWILLFFGGIILTVRAIFAA